MSLLAGFPDAEVQFTKQGEVFQPQQQAEAIRLVPDNGLTDLFVFSHGWNNDMDDARNLNANFFGRVREQLDSAVFQQLAAARKFGVLTVLWPSKKFAESDLIPSGAAAVQSAVMVTDVQKQLDDLKGVFALPDADARLEKAKGLVPQLEDKASARREFADLIRSLVPKEAANIPTVKAKQAEDASGTFFKLSGDKLMENLSKPVLPAVPKAAAGQGKATSVSGGAAGIGQFFSGTLSAARNLLNFTTYYQMKERAGLVGATGLNQVLRAIRDAAPDVRLHLIGHSFGGRVVTAATDALGEEERYRPNSLILLQAAFSHNGFASLFDGTNDGFFRKVVTENKVSGPIVITCTRNDRAVGIAYPLASLIAGQNAAALGDASDPYGGLGRNGAQHTPEAVDSPGGLLAVGGAYHFAPGALFNLNADPFITGHSDICKDEVAYALLTAVAGA